MRRSRLTLFAVVALASCGKETPPPSVAEFMKDPILLEATVIRCGQDRAATRYDTECINARDAVDRLAAAAAQTRRDELEAESERKRQALRRAQQAAAQARERAQDEARRREEAAYFGEFEPLPPEEQRVRPDPQPQVRGANDADDSGGAPPDPSAAARPDTGAQPTSRDASIPPNEAGARLPDVEAPADLESVREELQRRSDEIRD